MVSAVQSVDSKKRRRAVNVQPRPRLSKRLQTRRDKMIQSLVIKISRLMLNDMLVMGNMRLEWVQPENSHYHFVLWIKDAPIGKVEVRSGIPSQEKVQRLAALLVWLGFTDKAQIVIAGVETMIRLNRVHNLFYLPDQQPKRIER